LNIGSDEFGRLDFESLVIQLDCGWINFMQNKIYEPRLALCLT